jgi:TonB family protein
MKLTLALIIGLALWQPGAPPAPQDAARDCDEHADRVYTTGEVDEKAKIVRRPPPEFPESMRRRRQRVSGSVTLRLVLRPDGTVTDIEVLETSGEAFSRKSIEAAKRIKFEPAAKGGCLVAQSATVGYNYNSY